MSCFAVFHQFSNFAVVNISLRQGCCHRGLCLFSDRYSTQHCWRCVGWCILRCHPCARHLPEPRDWGVLRWYAVRRTSIAVYQRSLSDLSLCPEQQRRHLLPLGPEGCRKLRPDPHQTALAAAGLFAFLAPIADFGVHLLRFYLHGCVLREDPCCSAECSTCGHQQQCLNCRSWFFDADFFSTWFGAV